MRGESTYVQSAFDGVCKDAIKPEGHYVNLIESCPWYGGPEEGGWWGSDEIVRAWQVLPTKELANTTRNSVLALADELEAESLKEFGEQCLRELDWLEERGLEPSFLPEVDGESHFYVTVTKELPRNEYGDRQWS